MASVTFKLSEKDCQDVIHGKSEAVYQQLLDNLVVNLVTEPDPLVMYRLQGQILMLKQVSELKEKARKQLDE